MLRHCWWVLAVAGCAGALDDDPTPPIVPATRDAAVVDPDPDQGVPPVDQGVDAAGSTDQDPPAPDATRPDDMAPPPDAAPPLDMDPPPVDRGGCIEDVDCRGGQICEAGQCVDAPACTTDDDCADDARCEGGDCVPGARPDCVVDADCPNDGICVDGTCARGVCVEDADCAVNERCEAERCVPALIECERPVDCPMGEDCIAGRCEPVPPPECVVDADCPAGQSCVDGACEGPPPECVVDADCDPGASCVMGACEAPPPECVVDADCDPGASCVMGACEAPPPECVVDADCEAGARCEAGVCVPPMVAAGTCAEPLALGDVPLMGATAGDGAIAGACGGGAAPEVVYRHVAAADGPICFDTRESGFDTVLYVRADDCDGAELGCSDDGAFAGGLQSDVTIDAAAGQAYAVIVDGYDDRSGAFTLTASSGACGDDAPGPCDGIEVAEIGRQMGSTADALSRHTGGCGRTDGAPEAIYRLRVDVAGPICARTAGSDFDTVLYVRTACDDAGSEIACDDDVAVGADPTSALTFQAQAGVDYFVFVDGYVSVVDGPAAGAYVLELSQGACP